LKLSGGAFGGPGTALDAGRVAYLAAEVAAAHAAGGEIAVVVGGGNIARGRAAADFGWPQVTVDYIGMLATVANGLALRESLAALDEAAVVMSAFGVGECCARYERTRARELLAAGAVVIFVGGTGRPFFSTDTAAALRACELDADALLKATDVAGVYDREPAEAGAQLYESVSFDKVIARGLGIMDAAATALCRDHGVPIVVFSLYERGNIAKIIAGEKLGTYVG